MNRTRTLAAAALSASMLVACQASPNGGYGPLAVQEQPDGAMEALTQGTLRITDRCVRIDDGTEQTLLIWPENQTSWDDGEQTITFDGDAGSVVLADGDTVQISGGGFSAEESSEDLQTALDRFEWVSEPDAQCVAGGYWVVGGEARIETGE